MPIASLSDCAAMMERAAPFLVDIALRSVVILSLAAMATLAMRRSAAATRHWIWLLGFSGILLLPLLSALLPGWHALPRLNADRAPAVSQEYTGTPPAPALPVVAPTHVREEAIAARPEAAAPQPSSVAADAPPSAQMPTANFATPSSVVTPRPPLAWSFWLITLWLAGAFIVLAPVLVGHFSLWLLQRRCVRLAGDNWQELLNQLRQELGIERSVDLLSSPRRTMPMTWGMVRARLLLPETALQWSAEKCRSVLLHELGHVRRHDCAAQFLAQLGCALYWFNPLVWLAWRRMQIERECACDDLVLNHGTKASTYATDLLHIASIAPPIRFVGAAVAVARPSTLEERLVMILDSKRNRGPLTAKRGAGIAVMLFAAVLPVALLRAQNPAPTESGTAQGSTQAQPAAGVSIEPNPANPPQEPTQFGMGAGSRVRGGGRGMPFPTSGPTSMPSGRGGARGAFDSGMQGGRGSAPVTLGEGPTCTLDMTIYEVQVPPDQIGRLDLSTLTRASGNAADFEKSLAELGPAKPLYRASQSVRLAGDRITISTQTPYVTASTTNRSGGVMNSVNYSSVGALLSFAGQKTAGGDLELDMNIQVSSLSDSVTMISPDVHAKLFRSSVMLHKGVVTPQKPFAIMNIDASQPDTNGKAIAYIARVIVGTPQSPGTPARGN